MIHWSTESSKIARQTELLQFQMRMNRFICFLEPLLDSDFFLYFFFAGAGINRKAEFFFSVVLLRLKNS